MPFKHSLTFCCFNYFFFLSHSMLSLLLSALAIQITIDRQNRSYSRRNARAYTILFLFFLFFAFVSRRFRHRVIIELTATLLDYTAANSVFHFFAVCRSAPQPLACHYHSYSGFIIHRNEVFFFKFLFIFFQIF